MQDIEDLMRQQFQDAEQTPPAEAWDMIQQRMAAANAGEDGMRQSSAPVQPRVASRWIRTSVITVAAVVAVTAIVMFALPSTGKGGDDNVITVAQVSTDITETEPQAADASVGQTDAVQPSNTVNQTASATEPSPVAMPTVGNIQPDMPSEAPLSTVTPSTETTDPAPRTAVQRQTSVTAEPRADNHATAATDDHPRTTPDAKDSVVKPTTHQNSLDITIPNFITPNNDGINDCWIIEGAEQYGKVELQIYTAHSQRVYTSSDYHGEFCGDNLPAGNYFYVLVIRKQNFSRRGVLVIVR